MKRLPELTQDRVPHREQINISVNADDLARVDVVVHYLRQRYPNFRKIGRSTALRWAAAHSVLCIEQNQVKEV